MQNPADQAGLLTHCSATILRAQPVLALQLLRLALLLSPRETSSLKFAKEVFKRRGRWAAEQKVTEILATATQATAVTPPPLGIMDSLIESVTSSSTKTSISVPQMPVREEPARGEPARGEPARGEPAREAPASEVLAVIARTDAISNDNEIILDEVYSVEPDYIPSHESLSTIEPPLQTDREESGISTESSDDLVLKSDQIQPELVDNPNVDLFEEYLTRCGFEPAWKQFSTGFSQNTFGLVAYVNLLMTMQLVSENRKTEALLVLLKLIKESQDDSGGEQLFDRLFMQRSQRGDV